MKIFIIFWLTLVIIGLIRPKTCLPMQKWNIKILGKIYGFDTKPLSDEVICKKLRIWHTLFLILGIFMLFMVLTGRAK